MDSMLQGLFGGDDDDRRPQARDFISRYETGPIDQGYSDDEAYENFQRVSRHADPQTMRRWTHEGSHVAWGIPYVRRSHTWRIRTLDSSSAAHSILIHRGTPSLLTAPG